MRRLIADLYKIVYRITHSETGSFIFALTYISALNLLTVYGLIVLTEGLFPFLRHINKFFTTRYVVVPALVLLALNFWLMLPLYKLTEERSIKPHVGPIILYSLISAVLYGYTLFFTR